jgi:hypothetical protein
MNTPGRNAFCSPFFSTMMLHRMLVSNAVVKSKSCQNADFCLLVVVFKILICGSVASVRRMLCLLGALQFSERPFLLCNQQIKSERKLIHEKLFTPLSCYDQIILVYYLTTTVSHLHFAHTILWLVLIDLSFI